MTREIPLMREFLAGYRNPRVRLFRRQILNKPMQDIYTNKVHQVKAGIRGQADCYAFIRAGRPVFNLHGLAGWTKAQGNAIPVEIEFKGAKTVTSEEQVRWRTWCTEWGIPHITLRARIDEQPSDTMRRWTEELDNLVATLGS